MSASQIEPYPEHPTFGRARANARLMVGGKDCIIKAYIYKLRDGSYYTSVNPPSMINADLFEVVELQR